MPTIIIFDFSFTESEESVAAYDICSIFTLFPVNGTERDNSLKTLLQGRPIACDSQIIIV